MAPIVFMDLVWALGLVGLATASAATALAVHGAMPSALGLALALAAAILTWVGACAAVLFALPKPRPGRHPMMRGRDFYAWALSFIARRWLDVPPMSLLYRQSGLLRFLVLRAAGARIAFTAQLSSDAVLLDPGLLVIGEGALVGSQATLAGHFILDDQLVLAPIVIGPGAQVAIDVLLGPGVVLGKGAVIEARASIGPQSIVGDGAVIGATAALGRAVTIGDRARIPMGSVIPAKAQVPAEGTWPVAPDQDVIR